MIVRAARPDEWRAVRELRLRALSTDPKAFGARYEDERAEEPEAWRARMTSIASGSMFVLDDGGALMGLCGVKMEDEPGLAQLVSMWIAPEARGAGHSRALTDAAIARARDLGATRVQLWVNVDQKAAMRAYERAGFRGIGEPVRGTKDPSRTFQRMERAV